MKADWHPLRAQDPSLRLQQHGPIRPMLPDRTAIARQRLTVAVVAMAIVVVGLLAAEAWRWA